MSDQQDPMPLDQFIHIMRQKMEWLMGFSAAIQNKDLERFVTDTRTLFNRVAGKVKPPERAERDAALASFEKK